LPEVGTASDNEDHVSEEFDESEVVSACDEEQVNEPASPAQKTDHGCIPIYPVNDHFLFSGQIFISFGTLIPCNESTLGPKMWTDIFIGCWDILVSF